MATQMTTLPPKLRGKDDAKTKGFIYHSIVERLSAIVKVVPGCDDIAKELKDGVFEVKPIEDSFEPSWTKFVERELAQSGSSNCLEVAWFFLENYMYRFILGLKGYFDPASSGYLVDPWEGSKLESLEAALPSFLQVEEQNPKPSFEHLVLCCLWGNRSDLSLSSGAVDANVASGKSSGNLLVNDIVAVDEHLSRSQGGRVIIILDNCGAELLADLRFAAYLAEKGYIVELHAKAHPVFVSDATVRNIEQHIVRLEKAQSSLASTLRPLFEKKQLSVIDDAFYCSPEDFPDAPERLKESYRRATLVILKGDANYRRLLLDRAFPCDYPFADLATKTTSTPVFAIRTCKSPVAVGIARSTVEAVAVKDPNWCVNGTCGVLQFSKTI